MKGQTVGSGSSRCLRLSVTMIEDYLAVRPNSTTATNPNEPPRRVRRLVLLAQPVGVGSFLAV